MYKYRKDVKEQLFKDNSMSFLWMYYRFYGEFETPSNTESYEIQSQIYEQFDKHALQTLTAGNVILFSYIFQLFQVQEKDQTPAGDQTQVINPRSRGESQDQFKTNQSRKIRNYSQISFQNCKQFYQAEMGDVRTIGDSTDAHFTDEDKYQQQLITGGTSVYSKETSNYRDRLGSEQDNQNSKRLSKNSETSFDNHTRDSFWIEVQEYHMSGQKNQIERLLKKFFHKYIMDKRTYLSKLIEPNEQYFQLLIDIMMYSKYKILIDDSAANDFSLVDMLKKTKASIIRLLHQQEFKAAVAQLSVAEEIKVQKQCQASTAQDTYSALGYQTNNTISSITKTEKADQPSQLLINEYDNMESNFMQEPALDEENFTNLREYLQYKDFNRKAGFEDSQNGNKPGSIDNFSQQANYSFEIGQQKAQSAQVLIKMLQYLTMIGAMLMQVGASVECEECYTYYISIMESIQGKNTLKIGQAYYLMGMYYDDQQSFNKSLICYMKTLEIYKGHLGETHRSVGDCFYQIAVLFKHQNSFLKV